VKFPRTVFAIGACVVVSMAVVACGNSSDDSTSTSAAAPTTTAAASTAKATAEVKLGDSDLGQIVVDGSGRTLYLFEKDTSGDASTCSGACAQAWPPLMSKGMPTASGGVDSAKLTTLRRSDGSTQVAYNAHPLYYYAGDSAPGDTSGNDLDQFGAEWYAMDAAGDSVGDSGSSEDSTTSSGGSGYSY
jgi:predicted lipoprotein with Yx(FWY)xxD motif